MTNYITAIEVMFIHNDQIERYGGSIGVRDLGLFEAAVYRPQTGYYVDLIEQAAALWESLGENHPFIDGNKRTAFAVCYTFLAMNGLIISASPDNIFRFIIDLYRNNNFTFDHLVIWLRQNTLML